MLIFKKKFTTMTPDVNGLNKFTRPFASGEIKQNLRQYMKILHVWSFTTLIVFSEQFELFFEIHYPTCVICSCTLFNNKSLLTTENVILNRKAIYHWLVC